MKGTLSKTDSLQHTLHLMKSIISLSIFCFLLIACGTTKKTSQPAQPATPTVAETNAQTPQSIEKAQEATPVVVKTPEVTELPEVSKPPVESMEKPEQPQQQENQTTQTTIHENFDSLLSKYVSVNGNVNYEGFKSEKSKLRAYIALLGENLPEDSWSKNKKLAYWMNAYNAMTVDLILRNLPLQSIKDIKGPWEQRLWKLGSKWYNLDEIEHKILREMGDPRIHFGINCASFSCPPLHNEAFTAAKVDQQLEALAIAFVNDEKRNTLSTDAVEISKIFNWFSKDFKTEGSVVDYLNKYAKNPISPNAKVRYKDYDWNLNK